MERVDRLTATEVMWTPFHVDPRVPVPVSCFRGMIHCAGVVEPYMPDRVIRQFGFVQYIPDTPVRPIDEWRGPNARMYMVVHDPALFLWNAWNDHCLRLESRTFRGDHPSRTSHDYMEWYLAHTHEFIIPTDRDATQMSTPNPADMTSDARLQMIASYLYPVHPSKRRPPLDQYADYIDQACYAVEDLMIAPHDLTHTTMRDYSAGGSRQRRGQG